METVSSSTRNSLRPVDLAGVFIVQGGVALICWALVGLRPLVTPTFERWRRALELENANKEEAMLVAALESEGSARDMKLAAISRAGSTFMPQHSHGFSVRRLCPPAAIPPLPAALPAPSCSCASRRRGHCRRWGTDLKR